MPNSPSEQAAPRAEAEAGARRAGSTRAGCWRVGGITCGVLFCLFGVLSFVVLLVGRPYVREEALCGQCQAKLEGDYGVQGAIQRYFDQKKQYPAQLLDLYPNFLTKSSSFHCPADPSPPDAVSYLYRRPAPDASKDTIILICEHHTKFGVPVRLEVPLEGSGRWVSPSGERR